jgi:hypothetical protein
MVEEVEELSKYSLFGKYTPDALDQVQQLGSDRVDKEMQSRAPNLYELLHSLCRSSAATPEGQNVTRIMSILSVICFTKHQRKCNFLPGLMSLLFQSAGVKRHLYYITRAFGFTESYDSAMGSIQGLVAKVKDFIKSRIQLEGSFAFVYDNCDLSIGVSEQGNNKKSELISITSALIVPVVEPPLGGLKQAHFDPAVGVDLSDIYDDPLGTDNVQRQMTRSLVWQALQETFPTVMPTKMCNAGKVIQERFKFPRLEPLPPPPAGIRRPIPLLPIFMDQNTTSNNIEVLRNILREQCELQDNFFDQKPAILVGGDNKTLNRMWSAKHVAVDNSAEYDRLNFLVPIGGLFHAQMHAIDAILRAHWGPEAKPGLQNHSSLRYAAGRMGRRFVTPDSYVYSHARTFITDCWRGRIVAEFINVGLNLTGKDVLSADILTKLRGLTARQISNMVDRVTNSLVDDMLELTTLEDPERRQNLLFLRDARAYFILSHGIRHGDIGIIRLAINELILLFYGTNKNAYGREFVYLKHLIGTEHTGKEAARAIAGTLLVNPTGATDGWYPIDLCNEYHNRDIKDVWASRRTSTASVRQLSEFCTVNTIFLKPLRTKFHDLWGRNTSGHHIRAERSSTVLNLALQLRTTMKNFHSERNLYGSDLKWSVDTYQAAYKKLPQRICDYNERFLFHVDQHMDEYEDDDELAMIDSDMPEALAAIAWQGETNGVTGDEEELLESLK